VPSEKFSLVKVFKFLNDCQNKEDIVDFSISQTTLEQVFLHFAGMQVKNLN
jgi:hypothetical protein